MYKSGRKKIIVKIAVVLSSSVVWIPANSKIRLVVIVKVLTTTCLIFWNVLVENGLFIAASFFVIFF